MNFSQFSRLYLNGTSWNNYWTYRLIPQGYCLNLSMGFINDELQEVSKLCQTVIENSRLVSCISSLVRVEIVKTKFKKVVVCIQFPEQYPTTPLLIELKSKTLSTKLLDGLTEVCEKECKRLLGKAQILPTLRFIRNFIEENPLICCYDEIGALKKLLHDQDELKLRQKNSTILVKINQARYYYNAKAVIPDNYPENAVTLSDVDTNFPPLFGRYLTAQGKELARQCVEPSLRNKQPFSPSPSLHPVISFLIRSVKTLPQEDCQLCKITCFPNDPTKAVIDENADLHVDRLYCGHLFHLHCFLKFMKTPPFHGGKKCPKCGKKVYHDKWAVSDKLAEDRWAHQQARSRELAEVADFFE